MKKVDIDSAQRSFRWWLCQTGSGRPSDAGPGTGRARLGGGIEASLLALRDDDTELSWALRGLLGPLRPRTYDEAVRLLLWARHAPDGPRCRSYRAALSLVQRLDEHDIEEPGVERTTA